MPGPVHGAPDRLDSFGQGLDAAFRASERVETAALPEGELHALAAGDDGHGAHAPLPPPPTFGILDLDPPDQYVCQLGPCRHFLTRLVRLHTRNDEVADHDERHTEREYRCTLYGDISSDEVYSCDSWRPRLLSRLRLWLAGDGPERIAHLLPAQEQLSGWVSCRVCGRNENCTRWRERNGVLNLAARRATGKPVTYFCWCGEKQAPNAWEDFDGPATAR